MSQPAEQLAAERLRLAFDLFATGEAPMRQGLRREHPDATDAEIEARLIAWLQERPGAEAGDAVGRSVAWPRRGAGSKPHWPGSATTSATLAGAGPWSAGSPCPGGRSLASH